MVDYTLTPNKSLVKPNRGTYVDTWDTPINNDWDYVDRALGGTYTVGVQAVPATPVVLTNDQSRYQQIKVSNQTADITITFPLIEGSSTTSVGGIWIPAGDKKLEGIHPRWARVYAVGPDQKDVRVGQYVCVSHGRWTRGLKIEDSEGEKIVRRIDNNDILLISDEPMIDETLGQGL